MTTPQEILQKYWGYDSFRPLQAEVINAVLQKKDTLAIMPTGGGKSLCFQVPAIMNEGICLVVSPLIALIKDQVENLKKKGIGALAIYAGMPFPEVRQTLQNAAFGNYKFLYVSPERLETKLFLEFLPAIKPSLIAVDEAHCISQWGYDFRPSYMRIAALREELPNVPVIALTASATADVQNDICTNLLFRKESARFHQSFARPNLSYSAFNPPSKENKLLEILQNVKGSSIVYCKSRKQTQQIADFLKLNQISADYYHAGLIAAERTARQDNWVRNRTRTIVCTNAFGMGIDKPDVRVVVHYDVPDCLENYYQEAGRAGRDGKRAYAVLLHNKKETDDLIFRLETRYPTPQKLKLIYMALMNYINVAAGTGEGLSFDIDIASFAQAFKFSVLEATYGVQALAQEGLLTYNEFVFKHSQAEFIMSKSDLQEFEEQHPDLEYLVKGLLRSYEGIFDMPVTIYENLLAKFLKCPSSKIMEDLKKLTTYGVIKYSPPAEKPQVFLLQNRMYNDDVKINSRELAARKEHAAQRARAIADFVSNTVKCRSRSIASYFGDNDVPDCGICDNCITNTDARLSPEEFGEVAARVRELAAAEKHTLKEVLKLLRPVRERSSWLVIQFLMGEEVISAAGNNIIILRKKTITSA